MKKISKGLFLSIALALIATLLGTVFPIIGSAVFAIVLGLLLNNTLGIPADFQPGIKFSSKKILQASIILLGFSLSIQDIGTTGLSSLSVTLITIAVAFISAFLIGKWLKIPLNTKTLIAVGTAICGGSAIAAVSPIIEAEEDEVALSISTIFLFNVVAVFLFPFLGHLMNLSDAGFGLWAGTAINDTSSVVAAGYSYSETAGDYATIVKLTRATLIIPVSLIIAGIQIYKKKQHAEKVPLKQLFPWFILWFVVASLISSTGILPETFISGAKWLSRFMIAMALGSIGLSANLKDLLRTGKKPVLLGLITWFFVAASSLLIQFFQGLL
ncbi:YeiH family protein [Carnobacterium inhibens]|uniref:Sulfate exporter family transporter n=1 Tax=Carnobacterium inhibens TaxID=147709 RepID=A0ABR7T9X4_9LACT|nr:YeiH family protein [Carnobacterium inhibens]MBC9824259.1 putative sulfate exporter family transporter [Carnobacterium inhibens]MCM3511581.1 YeiH family protein [Carnobacterium inhibens]